MLHTTSPFDRELRSTTVLERFSRNGVEPRALGRDPRSTTVREGGLAKRLRQQEFKPPRALERVPRSTSVRERFPRSDLVEVTEGHL